MNQKRLFEESNKPSHKKTHVTYAYRISMIRDKSIRYESEVSNAILGARLVCETITACGQNDREQLIIVMLNAKNRVVGTNVVSVGSVNTSPVFLREVFKPAITASASAVVIGHNHPSGILEPSREDIMITKKIMAVAKLLNIIVHDHVIVDMDSSNFYSFNDQGLLENVRAEAAGIIRQL